MEKAKGLGTLIILWTLFFAGCTTSKTEEQMPKEVSEPEVIEYIKISSEEAQDMISKDVIILDVRTQEEYDEGHLRDAVLLPDYEIEEIVETVIEDKDRIIIVYCRSGARSAKVSKKLIEMGYTKVYDLGGIQDWTGEIVGNWLYPSYYNYFGGELPENIVMPIDFTTTKKINEQMPEFTFHIIGDNVERYGVSYDTTKYYIMVNENKIDCVTITDDTGAVIQRMENLETGNGASEEYMYGLSFEDWNFDGYLDIALWIYPGGSMRNDPHYYWLWNNELGQFVANEELMEISDFSTISIDGENQALIGYTRYGGSGGVSCTYKYLEGKFVLTQIVERNAESLPEDQTTYVMHTTVQERINGEMVITKDTYEPMK